MLSEPKYKVGDTVKVISEGQVYTTYDEKFKELGFYNHTRNDFNAEAYTGPNRWMVFGHTLHSWGGHNLYGIMNTVGKQILIHESGLAPILKNTDFTRENYRRYRNIMTIRQKNKKKFTID